VVAWVVFTHGLLRRLGDRDPYVAGQIQAALVVAPALVAWGGSEAAGLADPALWAWGALISAVIGLVMGAQYDPDSIHLV
jgi:hypothetical protein